MKIKRVNELLNDSSMQDRECNFKLTTKKHEAPHWFKEWSENVYEKKPPQWFKTYMEEFEEKLNKRFENLITKNNLIE